jgi:hypothetical protein
MRQKLAKQVRAVAKEEDMSVSQCLEWLVERALESLGKIPTISRCDVERDIDYAEKHPELCVSFDSTEDFLKDFDERVSKID